MNKQISTAAIGAFVVGALALSIVLLLVFSGDWFSKDKPRFVMYFQGSVNGLEVDAPVLFQGVNVGRVVKISVDVNLKHSEIDIPVIVEFNPHKAGLSALKEDPDQLNNMLQRLIDRGMRGKLVAQSLVTGKVAIELDFFPSSPLRLVKTDSPYPQIPTTLSDIEKFTVVFREAMDKVRELDMQSIVNSVSGITRAIENIVGSQKLEHIVNDLSDSMASLKNVTKTLDDELPVLMVKTKNTMDSLTRAGDKTHKLVSHLDSKVDPISNKTTIALHQLDITLKKGEVALQAVDDTLGSQSALKTELSTALKEIADAARAMRILSEYLSQHPESILRGKNL